MSAAEPTPSPALRSEQTIIYPKGSAPAEPRPDIANPSNGSSPWWAVSALLLAVAGGWVLFQKRRGLAPLGLGRNDRKLAVEESKNLGNRQYLVVASYEGRKFLLGVTPDRIQLISDVSKPPPQEASS